MKKTIILVLIGMLLITGCIQQTATYNEPQQQVQEPVGEEKPTATSLNECEDTLNGECVLASENCNSVTQVRGYGAEGCKDNEVCCIAK